MGRYLDIHPVNPQPRLLAQTAEVITGGGLIACPTDSGYALMCALGSKAPLDRIKQIRRLDDRHHFTLLASSFAQLGPFIDLDTWMFRLLKANTPGAYTFIVPASREVPRVMLQPKKRTVGVRVPTHGLAKAVVEHVGQPLVSTTMIPPVSDDLADDGDDPAAINDVGRGPLTDGWTVHDDWGQVLDVVLDSGECGLEPTTVVDLTSGEPEIVRVGAGDPSPFEH